MKNKVKKYEIRAREAAINGDAGIVLLLIINGGVRVDNDELKTLLEAADHRNRKLAFQRRKIMDLKNKRDGYYDDNGYWHGQGSLYCKQHAKQHPSTENLVKEEHY